MEFDAAASEYDAAVTAAGGPDDTGPAHAEEADSVAHALLRDKQHRFSDDGGPDGRLHCFSDDSAWGSAATPAAPVAEDTAMPDGPKVPRDGGAERAEKSAAAEKMQVIQRGRISRVGQAEQSPAAEKMQAIQRGRSAAAQDAAPPSLAMSASDAGDRSQVGHGGGRV